MKRIGILAFLLLFCAGCACAIPDLMELRAEKTRIFYDSDLFSPGEGNEPPFAGGDGSIDYTGPRDWSGTTVFWAIMDFVLIDGESMDVHALNRHLERQGEDYRIGLYVVKADAENTFLGRDYFEQLLFLMQQVPLDIVNIGYRHASEEDELVIQLFIDQNMMEPLPPDTFTYHRDLLCQNNVYGMGNPAVPGYIGLFAPHPRTEDYSGKSLMESLAALTQQSKKIAVSLPAAQFLETLVIGNLFCWEKEELTYFWRTSAYEELSPLFLSMWRNNLIADDSRHADAYLTRGFPGDTWNYACAEEGSFYPFYLIPQWSNWYVSTENVLLRQSGAKEAALDFLHRLDSDPVLAALVGNAGDAGERSPSDIQQMRTRLINELMFFPEIADDVNQRPALQKGVRLPAEIAKKLESIAEAVKENYPDSLESVMYLKPGWQEQAALLESVLDTQEMQQLKEQLRNVLTEQMAGGGK